MIHPATSWLPRIAPSATATPMIPAVAINRMKPRSTAVRRRSRAGSMPCGRCCSGRASWSVWTATSLSSGAESLTGPLASRTRATLAPPIQMEKFVIQGGVPLSGTIVPAGNKNGALPIMAACLLTDDEVIR